MSIGLQRETFKMGRLVVEAEVCVGGRCWWKVLVMYGIS